MVALLPMLLLGATTPTPLEQATRLEPIGWSADGQRAALRVFYGADHSEAPACVGYLDAAGKKFTVGLALVVLKGETVEHTFIIQTPAVEACTAPADAKTALEAAKLKLAELGIDRAAPGKVLTVKHTRTNETSSERNEVTTASWKDTWRALDAGQSVFELSLNSKSVEEAGVGELNLNGRWKLSGTTRTGAVKLGPLQYSRMMAGHYSLEVLALRSPDGARLLAFFQIQHGNMRGGSAEVQLLRLLP